MPISHTQSRGSKAKVTLEKSRKFDGYVKEKRAHSSRWKCCSITEICTKKGKVRKMNTLNLQPASLPVFVDVLFWEPQTHSQAKTVSSSSPF